MHRLPYRLILVAACGVGLPTSTWAGDDIQAPATVTGAQPTSPVAPPDEAAALKLVKDHLPELAGVLGPLQAANPAEYRKAIADLAAEARKLADLRAKNPARADLALEDWKARTRVELIAAQLASSPGPEHESDLRRAIEARVDQTIRRHRFEVDQGDAAVARLRENLARAEANRDKARAELQKAEANRDSKIENRFQALIPKKKVSPPAARARTRTKAVAPPTSPPTNPTKSSRIDGQRPFGGGVPLLAAAVPGLTVPMPSPRLPDDAIPLLAAPAPDAGEDR